MNNGLQESYMSNIYVAILLNEKCARTLRIQKELAGIIYQK